MSREYLSLLVRSFRTGWIESLTMKLILLFLFFSNGPAYAHLNESLKSYFHAWHLGKIPLFTYVSRGYTFHCLAFSSSMMLAISGSTTSSGSFNCFGHCQKMGVSIQKTNEHISKTNPNELKTTLEGGETLNQTVNGLNWDTRFLLLIHSFIRQGRLQNKNTNK